MKPSKMKKVGSTTFGLKPERGLGYGSAPCAGYYNLVEYTAKDSTVQINSPTMFELIERALGGHPEFGSELKITVNVEVVKLGKKSKKKCHNPWPSHRCRKRASR